MSTAPERTYDVVVLGGGAVGENAADRAGRSGLSVVLVESELVGGECSYWACMPSKALLRPGAVLAAARAVPGAREAVTGRLDVAAVLARRDRMASDWDDEGQVRWLESTGIDLVRGTGRLNGPRRVEVEQDEGVVVLTARHAVIVATGSEPVVPEVPGLAAARPWTSREATSSDDVPESLVVIGGGVVAVEMATAYADLGAAVTLLARGSRLLRGMEPTAGEAVADGLRAAGVDVRTGASVTGVRRDGKDVEVTLDGSEQPVRATEVLVATGRRPRTAEIGLDTVGLTPGDPLTVDDALQVTGVEGDWLYAVGDVTGRVATTHQGKYDGRVAGDVVAARFGPSSDETAAEQGATAWSRFRATADHAAVPQVVFSRPEVAAVGLTEAQAREAGRSVRVHHLEMTAAAGASLAAEDYRGSATFVVDTDRDVLLGVTFVGPEVAEMLQAATIAVVGEIPLARLWHAVPAYPTVNEIWLRMLEAHGL